MKDITAIILTKNEERNIKECIDSIRKTVKRIIVIDSFSTDDTVEIAKKCGAEVYQHIFENYSRQFKYGLNEFDIKTKWVLRIDADERLTKDSAREIEELCEKNMDTNVNGIVLRYRINFLGKDLKHGHVYPMRKLAVFKYGIGDIEDKHMDEHIILSEGTSVYAKKDCLHYAVQELNYWVNKMNWYSGREIFDYFGAKSEEVVNNDLDAKAKMKRFIKFKIYYKFPSSMRAYLYYIYGYYFRLGFLDGKAGKYFAFFHAYFYRMLVDAKIYEAKVTNNISEYEKGMK